MTRELEASYTVSIALTMVIPFALSVVTLPMWANFLDRVHVNEFRTRQSVLWVVSQLMLWFGAFTASLDLDRGQSTGAGNRSRRRFTGLAARPQRLRSTRRICPPTWGCM